MSCYDVLLEDYHAEQEALKVPFASMAESIESLIEFVTEDIKVDFSVALESADDIEALKEAAEKAKGSWIKNFIEKVKRWAEQIVAKAKELLAKATFGAANAGNKATKKLIASNAKTKDKIAKSNFKKTVYSEAELKKIGSDLLKALKDCQGEAKRFSGIEKINKILNDDDVRKDGFTKKDSSKEFWPAGTDANVLYKEYCDPYFNETIDYKAISTEINKAAAYVKKEIDKFDGSHEGTKEQFTSIMKVSTLLVKFAFETLTVGFYNSLKIVGACGVSLKKEAEEKKEEEA